MLITLDYLRQNRNCIFVYGDNLIHKGKKGAAIFRDEPNSYGFITKKYPCNYDNCFYKVDEYIPVFNYELDQLFKFICSYPHFTFLISKIGAGYANKYHIFEQVIEPGLQPLKAYPNCVFLF